MRRGDRPQITSRTFLRPAGALSLLMVSFLVGCMGGSDGQASFAAGDLSKLVLQPADLSRLWLQFDEGRQSSSDAPTGSRADPKRFNRIDGWKARYRRQGTATTRGPLVIESRADLFKGESDAEKDLKALRSDLTAGGDDATGWETLRAPALGEEAVAVTLGQGADAAAVRYYLVGWRQDNVTASILVNGFGGRTTLQDVLALAEKQQQRLAAAK